MYPFSLQIDHSCKHGVLAYCIGCVDLGFSMVAGLCVSIRKVKENYELVHRLQKVHRDYVSTRTDRIEALYNCVQAI